MEGRKFPKSARLLSQAHYKSLHKNSVRLFGEHITLNVGQRKSPTARLGITVSRKYGKAHERNRFKRVVRESFREIYRSLPQDMMLNVTPRNSGALLTKQAVLVDLQNLLATLLKPDA